MTKYIVVEKTTHVNADGKAEYSTYRKLDDAKEFMNAEGVVVKDELDGKNGNEAVNIGNGNTKKAEDLSEAYPSPTRPRLIPRATRRSTSL